MNFTSRLLLLFLFSVIFPFGRGLCQITLNGNVTLLSTGKPLNGAHVIIPGVKSVTYTDDSGNFSIVVPRTGHYHLRVTFIGCHTFEKEMDVREFRLPFLKIVMNEEQTMMEEVTITEKKKGGRMLDVPARIERISPEMILDNPGQQITNVLDNISGVNLNSTTGIFGSSQVVSMRGLSGNDQGRTLILLDGVPMNKADGGTVNWNAINRVDLGEILVIKGPGPAKYGSSAMGGVIEMNSGIPVKKISGSVSASYGTYETFKSTFTLGGIFHPVAGQGGLYYNLNGFYTRSGGYNPEIPAYLEPADTFYTNTRLREVMVGGRVGWIFKNGQQIEAGGEIFNDNRGRGIQIYETNGSYDQHNSYLFRMRYRSLKNRFKWDVSGYYNRENFRRMNEFMSDGAYNLYLVKSARTDWGMNAGFKVNAGKLQTISAGAEFRKGNVYGQDIYYTSTDLITNAGEIKLYAGYVQDELSLAAGKLKINLGLRFNGAVFQDGLFRIEFPSYSVEYLKDFQDTLVPKSGWTGLDPKLAVQYLFSPVTRIYLSLAKGFRAPNLDDLCRSGKRSDGFRIANPVLGPEDLYNIEAGADGILFKWIQLSGSFYYSVGHNFMYAIATGDSVNMGYKISPITQKRNISEVHIYGGEADADLSIRKNIHLTAGYTLSLSRIASAAGVSEDSLSNLSGNSLVDVPVHKVIAGFKWSNKILSANLVFRYISRRWINDLNQTDLVIGSDRFPSYSIISFKVWRTFFRRLTLAVDCDNLFDVRFIDNHYQRSPGRMVTGEINITF